MGEEFDNPLNALNEDAELEKELEKEQLLEDLMPLFEMETDDNYCSNCEHANKCIFLQSINDKIKIYNGMYKAKQIEPIENRWGCTAHKPKETLQIEQ